MRFNEVCRCISFFWPSRQKIQLRSKTLDSNWIYSPLQQQKNPENHPHEKENHLKQNLPFWRFQMSIFRGVKLSRLPLQGHWHGCTHRHQVVCDEGYAYQEEGLGFKLAVNFTKHTGNNPPPEIKLTISYVVPTVYLLTNPKKPVAKFPGNLTWRFSNLKNSRVF